MRTATATLKSISPYSQCPQAGRMTELETAKVMLTRTKTPFTQTQLDCEGLPPIFWLHIGTGVNFEKGYFCDMYFDHNGLFTEIEHIPY